MRVIHTEISEGRIISTIKWVKNPNIAVNVQLSTGSMAYGHHTSKKKQKARWIVLPTKKKRKREKEKERRR